jgi:HSP20 family molecular chaperone IbpA
MNLNYGDWLKFALDFQRKVQNMGFRPDMGKKELESLIEVANSLTSSTYQNEKADIPRQEENIPESGNDEAKDFWEQFPRPPEGGEITSDSLKSAYSPPVSIYESARKVNIHIILPGIASRSDLTVLFSHEALDLSGIRTIGNPGGEKRTERFHRTLRLPAPVEPSEAAATYRGGFLLISVPKKGPAPHSKVEVRFE